ncbi:MAG: hypothetical protein ABR886_03835 [Dehalococcoidales bacterium]
MKKNREKGYALPIVMIVVMVGALVIPPFLGHTSASLIGSRTYGQEISAQYAADAGVEYAIWSLTGGGGTQSEAAARDRQALGAFAASDRQVLGTFAANGTPSNLSTAGDTVSYTLPQPVNGLTTSVKISNCWETIAVDDFNSGGWVGGSGWLGDWTHTGTASVTSSGTPYEGAYHLLLQSADGYVKRSLDLSKQVSAHLRFRAKVNSFESADSAVCLVSSDGTGWKTAYSWTPAESDNAYHYFDINLTAYSFTSAFWIAFKANMNSTGDYFYVDDLDIVWEVGTYKSIAADTFESGGWAGGTGWSANWTHSGSSSVTTSGTPYQGNYHLLLQSGDGYAARPVDLSKQGVVRLQFRAKINDFEGNSTALARISSNGSTWTTVYTWDRSYDDNTYHYYDIDLSPYTLTDTFWVSFVAGMKHATDYFYIDNVDIESVHGYAITVTSGDRIIKAAVTTDGGVVKILSWNIL